MKTKLIVMLMVLALLATPKYGCFPEKIKVGKRTVTVIKCTEPPVNRYGCFQEIKAGRTVTKCVEPPIGVKP